MKFADKWKNKLDDSPLLEYALLDAVEEYITSIGRREEVYEFLGFPKEEWDEFVSGNKKVIDLIRGKNGEK